jgi:hypothetical protein
MMTSCTVNFTECPSFYPPGLGITAYYTWTDATNNPAGQYAILWLKDPSGNNHNGEAEYTETGTKYLSSVVDQVGTWTATVWAWNGTAWIVQTANCVVQQQTITLTRSKSCDNNATCGYDIDPPLKDLFACNETAKVCSQINTSSGTLDGKIWRLEWNHSEHGPPIYTQSILMSGGYTGWWYPWSAQVCTAFGPGFCWIDHYVDDVFIGNSNAFQFVGTSTTAIIDTASSAFYSGPFNQGAFEAIDIIYVGNTGDAGTIYRKYFYQKNSVWTVLTTIIMGNTVPALFEQFFNAGTPSNPTYNSFRDSVYIPSDVAGDVPFGVKVWGANETEPTTLSLVFRGSIKY